MATAAVEDPIRGEDEDRIQIITVLYRPLLEKVLNVEDIIEQVKIQFGSDDVTFTEVLELIATGATRSKITSRFIDALADKQEKRGLYRAVIDALDKSDDALAKHLEGTMEFNTKKRECYRSFLWLFAERLENIEPRALLSALESHLTKRDLEEIRSKVRNHGDCAGASELLLRLDRKSEECFDALISALDGNGLAELAKEMNGMKKFALGISAEDDESDDGNGEDIPVVGNVSEEQSDEVVDLRLWDYQEEVLTPALIGQNTVVVLPTGKGKTEVAIALIDRKFLARNPVGATNHRKQKSIFVVNKVPLVKQQKDRCLKYLRGRCDIGGASGEELNKVPLDIVIKNNDITVLTAQVLVNALKDQNIDISLSDIALIVLDECHHCQKSNPYNVLMAMYRDMKLNSPKLPRPQILGLTASPGVGESKNMIQAKDYITKLCANLDCRISRPKIYAKKLSEKKNSPEEIQVIMKGRSLDDGYFRVINVIMERIEDKIKLVEAGRTLVDENAEFSKMMSRRGTQSYEQGVVNLRKKIESRVENEEDRRELMTCVNYLRKYNNSLFINRDARTCDAISFMEDYIKEEEMSSPSGPADMLLKKMFRDKLGSLNRIAELHVSINPVLNKLGQILKKEYDREQDSRTIIFTKTRESAKALVKWLKEDEDLKAYNADILIGGSGMTSKEQFRNIELFKDEQQQCRILVATSVAEEGIDIQKCNIVVRYNYVTSDIGHLQTKGRSRAEFNGKIYVIVNSDLQLQDRELKNIIRVEMMNQAVKSLADSILDNPKTFDDQILREQKSDQKERRRESELKRITKANKVEKSGIILHCVKCYTEACSLDDIRSIRDQHHVVMNDLFSDKMKLVDLKKNPVIDDFKYLKKIHCANCQVKWGTMVVYQQQELPLIAVKNFTLKDTNNGRKLCPKAWKDVPYVIRSIDVDDLGKQNNLDVAAEQQKGDAKAQEDDEDEGLLEYPNIMQLDE